LMMMLREIESFFLKKLRKPGWFWLRLCKITPAHSHDDKCAVYCTNRFIAIQVKRYQSVLFTPLLDSNLLAQ
jgi:hypothetical protein